MGSLLIFENVCLFIIIKIILDLFCCYCVIIVCLFICSVIVFFVIFCFVFQASVFGVVRSTIFQTRYGALLLPHQQGSGHSDLWTGLTGNEALLIIATLYQHTVYELCRCCYAIL